MFFIDIIFFTLQNSLICLVLQCESNYISKKNTICQNRGRPQGNTNKVGNSYFLTKTPAGQHKEKWEISIFHPIAVLVAGCGCGCQLRLEIQRWLLVTGCWLEFQPTGCWLRLEIFPNKEPKPYQLSIAVALVWLMCVFGIVLAVIVTMLVSISCAT